MDRERAQAASGWFGGVAQQQAQCGPVEPSDAAITVEPAPQVRIAVECSEEIVRQKECHAWRSTSAQFLRVPIEMLNR